MGQYLIVRQLFFTKPCMTQLDLSAMNYDPFLYNCTISMSKMVDINDVDKEGFNVFHKLSATALPRTRLGKHFSAATFRGSREQQRQNLKTTVAAIRDLGGDVELLTHPTEGSAEDHNYTPLMLGMINSSVDLITALLDIGASVHTENNKKRTALLSLRQSLMLDELSCLKCVKALVSRGANINHRAEGNESAILTAAFFKMLDVVEYLLSQGADIDPRDWSPIRKTLLE